MRISFGRSSTPKNFYLTISLRRPIQHVRDFDSGCKRSLIWTLAALCCFAPFCTFAQLPVTRLFTVFPAGGKAGSAVEIELSGQEIESPQSLNFSDPRITARHLDANRFSISVPPDLEPFVCDVRVAGKFGLSNPRAFAVDTLPELVAPSTNTAAESAFPIAVNSIVNGKAASEGFQFFRFSAKKGARVLVECQAAELDSRLNPSLALLDCNGHEFQHRSAGELIDFQVPTDGDYLVKLNDFLYRGGAEYFYRLVISTRPRIDFVLPPAAQPGATAKLTLYGRNLPGGQPVTNLAHSGLALQRLVVDVEVPERSEISQSSGLALLRPASAQLDGFEYRLHSSNGVSNPSFLAFARGHLIAERDSNDKPEAAQTVTLPCSFAGQFFPANDKDWLQFKAKKGEVIWIDALSQRFGLATSPFMLVQRITKESGEEKASDVREIYEPENLPEFKSGSLDPSWRFEVKEDGLYRLEVRDLFNSKPDPRRVYLLSLRNEEPDFKLIASVMPSAPAKKDSKEGLLEVPFLRKGQTVALKVIALRRGYKGPIDISALGLPESVFVAPARIESTTNSTLLFITAAEESGGWAGQFQVLGTASLGSRQIMREARTTTVIWPSSDVSVDPSQVRFARDLAISVSGEEPASLVMAAAEEKTWEATTGAKLDIPFAITRSTDFNSALKLKPLGLLGSAAKETDVDGKATNATVRLDLAKVPAGEYQLVLQGDAQGKHKMPGKKDAKPRDATVTVYSRPVHLHVSQAATK